MNEIDLSQHVQDPEAARTIRAVMDGKMDPAAGATLLLRFWSPVEALNPSGARWPVINTRRDSLNDLDLLVLELNDQNKPEEARRLAEMNWKIANMIEHHELAVQCAATLAQMLSNDPSATRERLDLLEFCVPEILQWDRSPQVKAFMLAHLADARFNNRQGERTGLLACLKACDQALKMKDHLNIGWLGQIHYDAGTVLNEMSGEDNLRQSIQHLEEAMKCFRRDGDGAATGSALNNLGNSYRDLGELLGDASLVEKSIQVLEEALHYRDKPFLIQRTQGNLDRAVDILAGLSSQQQKRKSFWGRLKDTISPKKAVVESAPENQSQQDRMQQIEAFFHAGDNYFHEARAEEDEGRAAQNRKRAVDEYLAAFRLIAPGDPPALHAEGFHRLALLFLDGKEDDDVWPGVCFAHATRRLGEGSWRPISLARADYHQAHMMFVLGYPNNRDYLVQGKRLLAEAIPIVRQMGAPGEVEKQVLPYYKMFSGMLVASGDQESAREMAGEYEQQGLERIRQILNQPARSSLEQAYQNWLSMVQSAAGDALAALLGKLELESVRVLFDQTCDEFIHSEEMIQVARSYRAVGDFSGMFKALEDAERFARRARFSAPSAWCNLAAFCGSVPLKEEARRCVDRAQAVMRHAAAKNQAVLPGDTSGAWIPEYDLAEYQAEIDDTRRALETTSDQPRWDPKETASVLFPNDAARQAQLAQALAGQMR